MLILVSLPLLRSKTWPKQTMLWNLEESVQKMEYISDVCHKRPPSNGTSFQTCLPYCFRLQMNLWYGFYTCFQQTRDLFFHIYPSQLQNLLPILEIITQYSSISKLPQFYSVWFLFLYKPLLELSRNDGWFAVVMKFLARQHSSSCPTTSVTSRARNQCKKIFAPQTWFF